MNLQNSLILIALLLYSQVIAAQNYSSVAYVGTQDDLKDFIENEMQYPEEAYNNKINGDVEISFIVLPDGRISDIQVDKSANEFLNDEAVRIAKKMRWKPATKFGKPIGSRHQLTIPFHLRKYKKACRKRGFEIPPDFGYQVDTSYKVYEPDMVDYPPTPVFEKEDQDLADFINSHMQYPQLAFRQNISGTVVLKFIVETNGIASHFVVEESLGGGCDPEAKRIAKMLRWIPAVKDDLQVRSAMRMHITFRLPESGDLDYFYNNQNTSF